MGAPRVCAACSAANFERLLVETADLYLPALPENQRFDAITGDMIPADLDLSGEIAFEPHVQHGVVEILKAGGEPIPVQA